ncbi:metallophosphoesterase family protein [Bacillus mycoides]|nr:metallophosphoesterase family protein [Bacillus mycoides]QWI50429.1 metallophosphatase family protein [Bacillus mycoides]
MKRKIAIISDIYGNSHALKAVLKDISRRKVEMIINLGDSVYGPLDPLGIIEILMSNEMIHIKGRLLYSKLLFLFWVDIELYKNKML